MKDYSKFTGCLMPYTLKETGQQVPCGRCYNCLRKRSNQWSFRLEQELKVCSSAFFVTLTYGHKHLPISKNGFRTLSKADAKSFLKRLRTNIERYHVRDGNRDNLKLAPKLRYFLCGEYGGKNGRPHYHAIILNCLPQHIVDAWSKEGEEIGTFQIDSDVNQANIKYVLKYMHKDRTKRRGPSDDRQEEFQLMSKGLGYNYVTDATRRYHKDYKRTYTVLDAGIKLQLPRYIKEQIWSDKEELEEINAQCIEFMRVETDLFVNEMLKKYGNDWREKLKEYIARTQQKLESDKQARSLN